MRRTIRQTQQQSCETCFTRPKACMLKWAMGFARQGTTGEQNDHVRRCCDGVSSASELRQFEAQSAAAQRLPTRFASFCAFSLRRHSREVFRCAHHRFARRHRRRVTSCKGRTEQSFTRAWRRHTEAARSESRTARFSFVDVRKVASATHGICFLAACLSPDRSSVGKFRALSSCRR